MTRKRLLAALGLLVAAAVLFKGLSLFLGPAPLRLRPLLTADELGAPPPGRVVFITLDGVRHQDLLVAWSGLAERIRREGFFFGLDADGEQMFVSNTASRSLPGYRAIFSGHYQRQCITNDCPRIEVETLIDRLVDRTVAQAPAPGGTIAAERVTRGELTLAPGDVATFASWKKIPLATESNPRAVRSAALDPLENAPALPAPALEEIAAVLDQARRFPPHWPDARQDKFTWQLARAYDRARHPRFLYVSLADSDELGHNDDYPAYLETLRRYERDLLAWLDDAGLGGDDVSFVITTDHGRGESEFKSHGFWIPSGAAREELADGEEALLLQLSVPAMR